LETADQALVVARARSVPTATTSTPLEFRVWVLL